MDNHNPSQIMHGFRKIDPENWEFSNDDFVRGRPYLMRKIHRRKRVHSHSLQNLQAQNPLIESERQSMKDEIKRLKSDKEGLLAELQNQEQERKEFELQVTTLKDRLQHVEQHQKSIVAYVSSKPFKRRANRKVRILYQNHAKRAVYKHQAWILMQLSEV